MLNYSSLSKRALALCGECMQTDVIIKLSLRTAGCSESTAVHVGAVAAYGLSRNISKLFDSQNMAGSFECLPRLVTTWAFEAVVL